MKHTRIQSDFLYETSFYSLTRNTSCIQKSYLTDLEGLSLAQLDLEAQVTRDLDHPSVLEVSDVVTGHGRYEIVYAPFDGVFLPHLLNQSSLTEKQSVGLIVKLLTLLSYCHRKGVIHGAIHPACLFVNVDTDEIRVMGFQSQFYGLTSSYHKKVFDWCYFMYFSSQKMGCVPLKEHYSQDMYSVGMLLYRLLFNEALFPDIVSYGSYQNQLFSKSLLLASLSKGSSHRLYPALLRLLGLGDACPYRSSEEAILDIQSLMGLSDSVSFSSPDFCLLQESYGRELALNHLKTTFIEVQHGHFRAFLLSGRAGVGKTFLLNQFIKDLSLKPSQYRYMTFSKMRPSSYMGLIHFLSLLLCSVEKSDPVLWTSVRSVMLAYLDIFYLLCPHLFLQFELEIPDKPDLSLGSIDHLVRVFSELIQCFISSSKLMFFILEDFHLLDSETMDFFLSFLMQEHMSHCLFVFSFEPIEHGSRSRMEVFRDRLSDALSEDLQERELGGVTRQALSAYLFRSLGGKKDAVSVLAHCVYDLSKGYPLLSENCLYFLYKQGHIVWCSDAMTWSLNGLNLQVSLDGLKRLQSHPVVPEFSGATQEVVHLAVCLGPQFDVGLLATILGKSLSDTLRLLAPVVSMGVLNQVYMESSFYQLEEAFSGSLLWFSFSSQDHYDCFYQQLSFDFRQKMHFDIGQVMMEWYQQTLSPVLLFDIAYHFDQLQASHLLDFQCRVLIGHFIQVCQYAHRMGSVECADMYSEKAYYLMQNLSSNVDTELSFSVCFERAYCLYLSQKYQQSLDVLDCFLNSSLPQTQRLKLIEMKIIIYEALNDYEGIIQVASVALSLKHLRPYKGAFSRNLHILKDMVVVAFRFFSRSLFSKRRRPPSENEGLYLSIFSRLLEVISFKEPKRDLFYRFSFLSYLSRFSFHMYTPFGYFLLAFICFRLGRVDLGLSWARKAFFVACRHSSSLTLYQSCFLYTFIFSQWRYDRDTLFLKQLALKQRVRDQLSLRYQKSMDTLFFLQSICFSCPLQDVISYLDSLYMVFGTHLLGQYRGPLIDLSGAVLGEVPISLASFDFDHNFECINIDILRLMSSYILDTEFELSSFEPHLARLTTGVVGHFYAEGLLFYLLVCLKGYHDLSLLDQLKTRYQIIRYMRLFQKWMGLFPSFYRCRYALLRAEWVRCFTSDFVLAMRWYKVAIYYSKKGDFYSVLGVSYERLGSYMQAYKLPCYEAMYGGACQAYHLWGAHEKARLLEVFEKPSMGSFSEVFDFRTDILLSSFSDYFKSPDKIELMTSLCQDLVCAFSFDSVYFLMREGESFSVFTKKGKGDYQSLSELASLDLKVDKVGWVFEHQQFCEFRCGVGDVLFLSDQQGFAFPIMDMGAGHGVLYIETCLDKKGVFYQDKRGFIQFIERYLHLFSTFLSFQSSVSLPPSYGDPLQSTEPVLYSLMTGIAHDIRNPLGMILSSLELILDQGYENMLIQEYGDSIRCSILRLKNSTSRLLDYGRTYQYVPFDSVDLNILLGEVKSESFADCQKKDIIFSLQLQDVYQVLGDGLMLYQLFFNLILNACQAIKSCGTIYISARHCLFDVGSQKKQVPGVEIIIQDTGCGISQERLSKISDPFYTTKEGHVGLGLSIVSQIIRNHNGFYKIVSTPHLGTTVTVGLLSEVSLVSPVSSAYSEPVSLS